MPDVSVGKGLRAWCEAWTALEAVLTAVATALLVAVIAAFVFLVLHLHVCPSGISDRIKPNDSLTTLPITSTTSLTTSHQSDSTEATTSATTIVTGNASTTSVTGEPKKCSWTYSQKTTARTHYYYTDDKSARRTLVEDENFTEEEETTVGEEYANAVLALVKMKPPGRVVFGCVATAVSVRWAVTAASCVDNMETAHTLEDCVLMQRYGTREPGPAHALQDLQVHPSYSMGGFDVAALRVEGTLPLALQLPTPLSTRLLTVGMRLTLLGFGSFRGIDSNPQDRGLRGAHVYLVSKQFCSPEDDGTLRHLWAGRPADGAVPRGAGQLCGGVLQGRGEPCNYCAGTPLVRAGLIYGVMADSPHCAVTCEPTRYADMATLAVWIRALDNYEE